LFRSDSGFSPSFTLRFLLIGFALIGASVAFGRPDGQIQFGRPKAEKPLPNPFILGTSRDEAVKATKQLLETREVPLDREECNQQTGECTLISKQVVFIKGITTKSQLLHFTELPSADVRDWSKGRYVLRIQISPATPATAQVGISAKFDGQTTGVVGSEWVPLASKGELEDKLLRCLDQRVKGVECNEEK